MIQNALEVLQTTLERLLPPLEHGSPDPEVEAGPEWRQALKEFVEFATSVAPQKWLQFVTDNPHIIQWRTRIASHYGAHIKRQELHSAIGVLHNLREQSQNGKPMLPAGFAQRAYARVADMFDIVDFDSCRRLEMVGCGPLPVTLLHIADRTAIPELFGFDADEHSVALAERIVEQLDERRMTFGHSDGRHCSFGEADIVYVANLVTPKAKVLNQIADTIRPGATIIVRDPFGMGDLLAESCISELDPRLAMTGESGADSLFLSRHVYLRRKEDSTTTCRAPATT